MVAVRQRPGEKQRAEGEGDAGERERERVASLRSAAPPAPLHGVRQDGDGEHGRQERGALEEGEVRMAEIDADVAARKSAGEQRGEERAHTGGAGEPRTLADVEEETHPIASRGARFERSRPVRSRVS